ncbi:MAG: ribosome hibernation-promoting factor, HPF/YfiA family [Chloroflexota bacterium]|nr:MAG: ribosome-associated translation inhibitor RaiA [Chloroflexota bacterium]
MGKAKQRNDGMDVQVKGNRFSVTPDVRHHVVHKMQRLQKYFDRIISIDVELSSERTRDADHQNHVEATTHVAGRTIRVTAAHGDMLAAVDEAVDKLYRQLNRQKERLKSHHGVPLSEMPLAVNGDPDETDLTEAHDWDESAVRVQTIDMKPQFEDEALTELRAHTRDFYVFLNASTEQVNVLYKDANGGYCLVQPPPR